MSKFLTKLITFSIGGMLYLTGCVSSTKFVEAGPERNGYGYSVQGIKAEPTTATAMASAMVKDIYVARFEGNTETSAEQAKTYSILAAYKHCLKDGQSAMVINGPENYSETSTYLTKVESMSSISGQTIPKIDFYPVTENYPRYGIIFSCVQKRPALAGFGKSLRVTNDVREGDLITSVEEGLTADVAGFDVVREAPAQTLVAKILSETPELKRVSSLMIEKVCDSTRDKTASCRR